MIGAGLIALAFGFNGYLAYRAFMSWIAFKTPPHGLKSTEAQELGSRIGKLEAAMMRRAV